MKAGPRRMNPLHRLAWACLVAHSILTKPAPKRRVSAVPFWLFGRHYPAKDSFSGPLAWFWWHFVLPYHRIDHAVLNRNHAMRSAWRGRNV